MITTYVYIPVQVLAHEIGHHFGMALDFDKKNGGNNGQCNGKGIMSYGDAPNKWSSSSVSDFKGHYIEEECGDQCLKGCVYNTNTELF